MDVKFTEIETQFKWFREISDLNDAKQQKEIEDLKAEIELLRNKK